jgi:hypothetical protein
MDKDSKQLSLHEIAESLSNRYEERDPACIAQTNVYATISRHAQSPANSVAKTYCNDKVIGDTFPRSCSLGTHAFRANEQDTTAQASALKAAGCERISREKATGGRWNRPELQRLLDHLRKGDVLVVWKLDRLSRSLRDVLTIMERIQEAKAGFRSLTEAIDTTTPAGRMMMQMIGSFAEFERAMLRERTRAGLESARGEGRIGGRRPKLLPQQQTEVLKMVT